MQNFVYYTPTEILFGKETELQVAKEVKKWNGTRVLIVYGGGSVVRNGLLGRVEGILKEAGICYDAIGGVKPNPLLSFAEEGVKKACDIGADFILAVGGGSVIDTAKGIAVGAKYPEESLWDIWTGKVKVSQALPLGVILTIPAAGSEMSSSAVLTNTDLGKKSGFGSELNRPKFAIMNPELTYTLPKYQVACGVVDIFMHTVERYFTGVEQNQITDEIAEGVLRTVIANGKKAYEDPHDYEAMSEIMWCGSLSHNDLTGLGRGKDFTVHKFGHELSARFDVTHGASLAAMWGTWARFVYELDLPRFKRYAKKVWGIQNDDGMKAALEGIEATESFFKELHMPICIGELDCGVLGEDILQSMAASITNGGASTIGVFKKLDQVQVYEVLKRANHK